MCFNSLMFSVTHSRLNIFHNLSFYTSTKSHRLTTETSRFEQLAQGRYVAVLNQESNPWPFIPPLMASSTAYYCGVVGYKPSGMMWSALLEDGLIIEAYHIIIIIIIIITVQTVTIDDVGSSTRHYLFHFTPSPVIDTHAQRWRFLFTNCLHFHVFNPFSPTLFLTVAKMSITMHSTPYWSNPPF